MRNLSYNLFKEAHTQSLLNIIINLFKEAHTQSLLNIIIYLLPTYGYVTEFRLAIYIGH